MKKLFLLMLALLILPVRGLAASNDFKIIDETLKSQILRYAGVSENDLELYTEIFTAIDNGDFDKADLLHKKTHPAATLRGVFYSQIIPLSAFPPPR